MPLIAFEHTGETMSNSISVSEHPSSAGPALFSWAGPGGDLQRREGRPLDETFESLGVHGVSLRAKGDRLYVLRQDVCLSCFEIRFATLLSPEEMNSLSEVGAFTSWTPWVTSCVQNTVRTLADRLLSSESGPSGYAIHLATLEIHPFELERHSSCPRCAHPVEDTAEGATVRLEPRPAKDPRSYRVAEEDKEDVQFEKYVNPYCGMFGKTVRLGRHHPYNAQAVGAFQEPNRTFGPVSWSGHKASYLSSRMVGLFEAFERHAGLRCRTKRSRVRGTFEELRAQALDPRSCGFYDESYYAKFQDCVPFTGTLPLEWVWGYSLTGNRPVLVPHQLVYYGSIPEGEPRILLGNSSGCATGGCLEEAIFHGLLELIERDAFLIHWYARLTPPKIDVDSMHDRNLRFLIARLRRADLDVHLLDTRLDIRVPSVTAVVVRRDDRLGSLALASGCSYDPESAIASALDEVASYQAGFADRTGNAERRLRPADHDFSRVRIMDDHAAFYGFPENRPLAEFLYAGTGSRTVDECYSDWNQGRPPEVDLCECVQHCIGQIQAGGLNEVVVVEQTSPEQMRLGLRTVRMLVPGLMPIDFGHQRCRAATLERMYTVPTRLGLRAEPLTLDTLYCAPHPFP